LESGERVLAKKSLNHRERLENCLADGSIDRIPVALWRHFPVDDQDAGRLAAAVLNFQATYDFDLVKVTPASSYCLKDWGVLDQWRGSTEGTREYTRRVIHEPHDWERLQILDPYRGHLEEQLRCLEMIVAQLGPDIPVIPTIFNPLSQAKNLAGGEKLLAHLRSSPDLLHAGLRTIAESTSRFIDVARQQGIAGIFYAVQHAQRGLLTKEEYVAFGKAYDLQVLRSAQGLWLNMLHLHGREVMFDLFLDYPVAVINWHDQESPPSLGEARARFPGALCGGLQREKTLVLGDPTLVKAETHAAIMATNGRRFILGTGCVVPITAPHGNLAAVRRSVEWEN